MIRIVGEENENCSSYLKTDASSVKKRVAEGSWYDDYDEELNYWEVSIDGPSNDPDWKSYTDSNAYEVGQEIIKKSKISSLVKDGLIYDIEVETLGYEDISFVFRTDDPEVAVEVAEKISEYANKPADYKSKGWKPWARAILFGPSNEDLDYLEDSEVSFF